MKVEKRKRPMRFRARSCSPIIIRVHLRDNEEVAGEPTGLIKVYAQFTVCATGHRDALELEYASLFLAQLFAAGDDPRGRDHAVPRQGRGSLFKEPDDYRNILASDLSDGTVGDVLSLTPLALVGSPSNLAICAQLVILCGGII